MTQHYLKPLFAPESVAVFGASDRVDAVGQIVFSNMLKSGYKGALFPINTTREVVQGHKAYLHWSLPTICRAKAWDKN